MKTPDCVLDGEVCALDEHGRPELLGDAAGQARDADRLRGLRPARGRGRAARRPAARRAPPARLEALLDRRNRDVRLSEAFDDGAALLEAAQEQGLEGIVAKRADSPVPAGQADARVAEDQDARPPGVRDRRLHEGPGPARGPVRLARARRRGRATSSSTSATSAPGSPTRHRRAAREAAAARAERAAVRESSRRCRRCGRRTSSGSSRSSSPRSSSSSGRTTAGCARRPSRGCATDKPAREVHREEPLPAEIRGGKRVLKLSNLDKVFWPDEGITKGDLLAYYRAVAPVLLPHLRDRPFTMKRYPDGIERRPLLPEGRAGAHARLDPDACVRGVDPRDAAAHARRSASRSSTTSSRSSGW